MTRDMTRRQFAEAIERNGFKLLVFWLIDTRREGQMYGLVFRSNGKILRRESLANALQRRDRLSAEAAP